MASLSVTDGLAVFVKRECPTCAQIAPALAELEAAGVTVVTQDDPDFPPGVAARHDADLELSYRNRVEIVPTLLRFEGGMERERVIGWMRDEWRTLTALPDLGAELPPFRPGCGSASVEPGVAERLEARFGTRLTARRVEIGAGEDEQEALFARGWSDGLPLVAPTPERVLRMLAGTRRDPREVVAVVPPDLAECSVEKVAINAVMAGCRPEYLEVVIAAVKAACTDEFNMHGLLATTYFSGPVVIVNGPVATELGMNGGVNALGQGNRANSTIGRALQLVVRNVGGGRPGEIDRATLGSPGKLGWSFAELEATSPWEPLSVERGVPPGRSAVTLFAGHGPIPIWDQLSRTPESLARSFAACLQAYPHPKLALQFDCVVVVSPEHARVFAEAGWDKSRLRDELNALLTRPGAEMVRGAGGIAEGMPTAFAEAAIPKFRPDGLWFVHAGGGAGLFSAIIGGWVQGAMGSTPVTALVED